MDIYELFYKHCKTKKIPAGMTEANLMSREEFKQALDEVGQLDTIVSLRGENIEATATHDAGAFARCSYCKGGVTL